MITWRVGDRVRHKTQGWVGCILELVEPYGQASVLFDQGANPLWFPLSDFVPHLEPVMPPVIADLSRASMRPCEVRPLIGKDNGGR